MFNCLCFMFMLHVYVSCLCFMFMFMFHVSCLCFMFHVYASCLIELWCRLYLRQKHTSQIAPIAVNSFKPAHESK